MQASKIGDISVNGMGARMGWPQSRFHAKRERGSDHIHITIPAGPKTKNTLTLRVKESELRALVEWLKD